MLPILAVVERRVPTKHVETKELTPDLWPALENLFGKKADRTPPTTEVGEDRPCSSRVMDWLSCGRCPA